MEVFILMGIKHCGKSTLGEILSEKLNCAFYDTDDVIKLLTNKTPREIFSSEGEDAFKFAEKNACSFLEEKILKEKSSAVIATGGGICNNPEALKILHGLGKFVFLNISEKTAFERILWEVTVSDDKSAGQTGVKISGLPAYIAKKNPRTLEDAGTIFHEFYCERIKLYKEAADITVDMNDRTKEENVSRLLEII